MRRTILVVFALGVLLEAAGRLCARSFSRHQPVRAYHLDYPRRILYGHSLRDGPNARRLSLARYGIWLVSFRWRSFSSLATACGQQLPENPYALLVTRDGTLWIGTYAGLASWNNGKLTQYPEVGARFITSLLEDRSGTVWGSAGRSAGNPYRAAVRHSKRQQTMLRTRRRLRQFRLEFGSGQFRRSLGWRRIRSLALEARSAEVLCDARTAACRPDSIRRRRLIAGIMGGGLRKVVGDKLESYPIRSAMSSNATLPDRDIHANKMLRDRDGGLWIGTNQRGLIHVHHGRTDVFTAENGLSGNIIAGLLRS